MTDVLYDEFGDDYYYRCDRDGCPKPTGRGHMAVRDADLDADRHDELHDDGVI